MIVGRVRELDDLDAMVAAARLGTSGAVVIRGDAGIGKTALLDELVERAGTCLILPRRRDRAGDRDAVRRSARGVAPASRAARRDPGPAGSGVAAAFALDEAAPDRLAVSAGTVSLLAEMAERRPVLVVVDDVHWIDQPSIGALLFTARRIAAERLVVVFAVRSDVETVLDGAGLREIVLEPLGDRDALAVLDARWGSLDPGVARRVTAAAVGNPLALVEISAALSDEQRVGAAPLGDLLPVTGTVDRGVRRRLSTLSAQTLPRAADPRRRRAGGARGRRGSAPAETAGLVTLGRGTAAFVHPMFQSAVYQLADPAERRAAHRWIAEALPADDEYRRASHLAAAATSPDDALAAMLERAAGEVRQTAALRPRRGRWPKRPTCRSTTRRAAVACTPRRPRRTSPVTPPKPSGWPSWPSTWPRSADAATAMHRLAVIGDWYAGGVTAP